MRRWYRQVSAILLVAVILLALSGCESSEDPQMDNMDNAEERASRVGDEATPETGSAPTAETDAVDSSRPLTVYWLGESYDPDGDLPPLIRSFHEPVGRGPYDFDRAIQYTAQIDDPGQSAGVLLEETRIERWESLLAELATTGNVQNSAPYWNNPCWSQREVALETGRATIFFRDGSLPDQPSGNAIATGTECPPEYAELYAHVFLGETVVRIRIIDTASLARKSDGTPGPANPYFSHTGIDAVVRALKPRPENVVYVGATATMEALFAEATEYASTPTVAPPATVEPTPTLPEIQLANIADTVLLPSDFEAHGEFGWARIGIEPPAELIPGAGAWICNTNDPTLRFTFATPITEVFENAYERTIIVQSIAGSPDSTSDEAIQAMMDARQAQACGTWTDGDGQTWNVEIIDVPVVRSDEVVAFRVLNVDQPERKPQVAVIAVRQGPIVTVTTQIETGSLHDSLTELLAVITSERVANLIAAGTVP